MIPKKPLLLTLCFLLLLPGCSQTAQSLQESAPLGESSASQTPPVSESAGSPDTRLDHMSSTFYLSAEDETTLLLNELGTLPLAQAGGPVDWMWQPGTLAYCPTLSVDTLSAPLEQLLPTSSFYALLLDAHGQPAGDAFFHPSAESTYIERLALKPNLDDTFDLHHHADTLLSAMEHAGFAPDATTVILTRLTGPEDFSFCYLLDDGEKRSFYILERTHMTSRLDIAPGTLLSSEELAELMQDYYAGPREAFYLPETFYTPRPDAYALYWAVQNDAQLFIADELSYELAQTIRQYQNIFQKFSFSHSFADVNELNAPILVDIAASNAPSFAISPSNGDVPASSDPILAYIDQMERGGLRYSHLCTGDDVRARAKALFGEHYTTPLHGGEVFRYIPELDLYYVSGDLGISSVQYPILYEYSQSGDTITAHVYHLWLHFDGSWSSEDGATNFSGNTEARTWLQKNKGDVQAYEYVFTQTQNGLTLLSFTLL